MTTTEKSEKVFTPPLLNRLEPVAGKSRSTCFPAEKQEHFLQVLHRSHLTRLLSVCQDRERVPDYLHSPSFGHRPSNQVQPSEIHQWRRRTVWTGNASGAVYPVSSSVIRRVPGPAIATVMVFSSIWPKSVMPPMTVLDKPVVTVTAKLGLIEPRKVIAPMAAFKSPGALSVMTTPVPATVSSTRNRN